MTERPSPASRQLRSGSAPDLLSMLQIARIQLKRKSCFPISISIGIKTNSSLTNKSPKSKFESLHFHGSERNKRANMCSFSRKVARTFSVRRSRRRSITKWIHLHTSTIRLHQSQSRCTRKVSTYERSDRIRHRVGATRQPTAHSDFRDARVRVPDAALIRNLCNCVTPTLTWRQPERVRLAVIPRKPQYLSRAEAAEDLSRFN